MITIEMASNSTSTPYLHANLALAMGKLKYDSERIYCTCASAFQQIGLICLVSRIDSKSTY